MGTQNKTTSTNQYNPLAENAYNSMIPGASGALMGNITNPFSNSMFNTQLGMGMNALNQRWGSMNNATQQSLQARGMGGNGALASNQLLQNMRQNSANTSTLQNNLLLNAQQLRQQSIGQAMSFNPQQTGQTSVQQTTGAGTWAGPLISAGLGLATGGLSSLMGGGSQTPFSSMASNPFLQNPTYQGAINPAQTFNSNYGSLGPQQY